MDRTNLELESEIGQRPFPSVLYGLNAADTDNPLVLGNYQSDFPSGKMRDFYEAHNADWHNDGALQQIHSLRGSENGFYRNNYFSCETQRQTIRRTSYIPNYPFGISDIKVTSTYDATDRCPSNWESAGADLNDRALGPFIDLCQKYGERPDPITGLTVLSKDQSCPGGYERLGQNLNEGTAKKGEKLYACVSRQPGVPLQAVKATSNKKGGSRCGDGWNWIPTDLNKGSGGNYVFLCYR